MDVTKPAKDYVRFVGGIVKGGERFVTNVYRQLEKNATKIAKVPTKSTKKQVN